VDRFPWVGGALLGLLTYKPQLAALIPVALIAGRRWKALAGAFLSASCLILASIMILGQEAWTAYWHFIPVARRIFESGAMPIFKIGTVYNAVLLAGGNYEAARLLQALVMVAAAAGVFWVWWREFSLPIRASILVLGILLFTPHAFPYDFVLLALPLAWLGWEGYQQGWLPGEQPLLLFGWLIPLLIPALGKTHLQLAPLVVMALMVIALRRGKHDNHSIIPIHSNS
jgi:alpha-1,2-mannosyltransferase